MLCLSLVVAAAFGGIVKAQMTPSIPVAPGDTLSIEVLEDASLGRTAKVDAAGRIMLPQLGGVDVAGLDLDAVRAAIESELVEAGLIREPQVLVEMAQYRPFYVDGDVDRRGAISYEAGLTVRHALVLAGGVAQEDGAPSAAELLKLNAGWRANAFALLEVNSRIARLEAELEMRPEALSEGAGADTAMEVPARSVLSLDRDLLADSRILRAAKKAHLLDLISVVDVELDVLSQQAADQRAESDLQKQDLDNANALAGRGLMSQPRVRELQRERLQLTRSILEVEGYTARARQNKATIGYEIETAEREWRMETRSSLRDAIIERARLRTEAERLSAEFLGEGIRLDEEAALEYAEPLIVIHRTRGAEETSFPADMTTPILPGDILEVSLEPEPQG